MVSVFVVGSPACPSAFVQLLIRRAETCADRVSAAEWDQVFGAAIAADSTPTARIALAARLTRVDPQRAIGAWEAAWDQARRLGSARWRAICCYNLARVQLRLGQSDRAVRFQQLAITAEMETEEFAETAALVAKTLP